HRTNFAAQRECQNAAFLQRMDAGGPAARHRRQRTGAHTSFPCRRTGWEGDGEPDGGLRTSSAPSRKQHDKHEDLEDVTSMPLGCAGARAG
ncbi:hypothetical protein MY11210_008835, partial [Beauveria gryllotalpidicola]